MAEFKVLHQNRPSVLGINLLFIQFSLFMFFFFIICYAVVKSCCSIACLMMNIALSDPCPLSLTMRADVSSLERELHGLPFMQWISTLESFTLF